MQPSSCERSKISTIDSLHSKKNCNLKDFSESRNFSNKDYSNLKFIENIDDRNFIVRENLKALRNQLVCENNNSNCKFNFDKIIINDNNDYNKNINLNEISFEQINRANYLNIKRNFNNNVSNFRTNKKTNYEKEAEKMNKNNNNKIIKGNSEIDSSETENEEEELNTIYESCNSPESNSVLNKINFENKILNENESNNKINNNYGEFDLNDFHSVKCKGEFDDSMLEEDENELIDNKKNENELRTKILNLNFDFFKAKAKNRQLRVKNVKAFFIFIFKSKNKFWLEYLL